MASGNPQRPPAKLKSTLPLSSRGRFPIPPCTLHSRMQDWCIYGIIYHYAPFLLSNPMVMFSGPNSIILNQGPKVHHQFQRRTLQLISLAIHGGVTTTKNDPPLMVLPQFQIVTELGPIGHTISLWQIWHPLVLYGPLAISRFPGQLWPQAISCHH
ncbi:hypothetical protein O181_107533 [Austropuccinia psidii MF-1]|uniref:Uncharacterized protein n=1 Tax=Austropuccinia psidii MF-1 TaxID=1389203 RepID=A0A9Q3JR25_9BASI|nr:hypothetical protein [Austropuccinia psidii MF-1]